MINIKKELYEDIWNVINNKLQVKKNFNDLIPDPINELIQKLETSYYEIVNNIELLVREEFGDVIKVIKRIDESYSKKIQPLLDEIKKYKIR